MTETNVAELVTDTTRAAEVGEVRERIWKIRDSLHASLIVWTVGIECLIEPDVCIRRRAERFIAIGGDAMEQGDLGGMEGAVL